MLHKNIEIGKMLKDARERKNLTQEQLAQKVGKKRSYISRIESQEGDHINIKTLVDIVEKGLGKKVKIEF
jgi:transcriptional regulator with XRE-family HTH domain